VQGTMRSLMLPCLMAAALLGIAPSSFAAETASMTLTGVGTNGALGGVYIGPYVGTIDGVTTPLICDDFFDDSYIPESWTANVYGISDYASLRFGSSSAQIGYEEVAWLSQQLTNQSLGLATYLPCPPGDNCAGDIQYAIWAVFDPAALLNLNGSGGNLANANLWLSAAASQYSTGDYSNVSVYTPLVDSAHPVTCNGHDCPSSPPQEFIVVKTPEPSALAILGLDFSAVGALIFFLRRRKTT
jgi:hypothetical protein